MPTEPLFYNTFETASKEEWIEAIEKELSPDATISSLVWKVEPGLTVDPFYCLDSRPISSSGLLPAESGDWHICDRLSGIQPGTLADRLKAANLGGANSVEIWQDSLNDPHALQPVSDHGKLEIMVRGNMDVLDWATGNNGNVSVPERLTLLVDPFFDADPSYSAHLDLFASLFEQPGRSWKGLRAGCIDGERFRDAGAGVVTTIACQLASLSEWCLSFSERAVTADTYVDRLTVVAAIGHSTFLEIAGLRALRLLLPQVSSQFSQAPGKLKMPRIYAVTSCDATADIDPALHLVHSTSQAVAAVLGGADSIGISPLTASTTDPEESCRLVRNIQLLLKHEAMFNRVSGALAGSFYIEQLTDLIAEAAWKRFLSIEDGGGFAAQLLNGKLEADLKAEYARSRALEATSEK